MATASVVAAGLPNAPSPMAIAFRLNDKLLLARKAWVKYGIYVLSGISILRSKIGCLMEITHINTSI